MMVKGFDELLQLGRELEAAWLQRQRLLLIVTAECNPRVCKLFSQRGNGINVKLSAKVPLSVVWNFIKQPCKKCGEQVRVTLEAGG